MAAERGCELSTLLAMSRPLTSRQVLLVRKDEQKALLHLSVAQYPVQLLLCLVYPLSVLTVHDEHETLRAGVVMSPERPDLVLPSDVPYIEPYVLIRDGLDVESN